MEEDIIEEINENPVVIKILKELHDTQAERISLTLNLEFMTIMNTKMAEELGRLDGTKPSKVVEEFAYKAYEDIKNKGK